MDLMPSLDVWAMIREATPTVKAVMALLAVMSVASWSVILHKCFTLLPASRASRAALARLVAALDQGLDLTAVLEAVPVRPGVPLSLAAASARASRRGPAKAAHLAGAGALREQERGIGLLAACSGAAPFIGLFGTVWGVMHAFAALGRVQTQALSLVAPGIAEALVATALGLAVAIPAGVAVNLFVGLVDGLERDLELFESLFAPGRPGSRQEG